MNSLHPLLRRLATKSHGGIFSKDETRIVPIEEPDKACEVACVVLPDGTSVCRPNKATMLASLAAGGTLFAVHTARFPLSLFVPAGKDAKKFEWFYDIRGMAQVLKPGAFAEYFRGVVQDEPLTVAALAENLGTIPETVMHDKVVVDVFGAMALNDPDSENGDINIQQRIGESREVEEEAVSAAFDRAFKAFFDDDGVIRLVVSSFRVSSPDRQEALREQMLGNAQAIAEARRQKALLDAKAAELDEIQHRLDKARLEHDLAKVESETKALKDSATSLFNGSAGVGGQALGILDELLSRLHATGIAPVLAQALDAAGKGDAASRLQALAADAGNFGGTVGIDLDVATRRIAPPCPVMEQGKLYGLVVRPPRDGHLTVLDICDDGSVVPVVPCTDSCSSSTTVRAGDVVSIGRPGSPWLKIPFQQCESSGMDRLVAIVTDKPLLSSGETVRFGGDLPVQTVQALIARLAALPRGSWSAGVLLVCIQPTRLPA